MSQFSPPEVIHQELTRRLNAASGRLWTQEKAISLIAEGIRLIEKRDRTGTLTSQEVARLNIVGANMTTLQTLVEKADALRAAWNSGQTPDIFSDANWQ